MNAFTCLTLSLALTAPPEAFQSQVRPTEPRTPAEQQRTFHLPAGFEIQLFAAEPDIQKPMNLAVDAAGRVWMSGSVEYPYAAAEGKGQDAIKVLEDTDGDGKADRITTFVDGLNIPIGLYPYRDGVVAYSIPNIWFFRDTDGDGRADVREVLYGPLGVPRDTHGMQNAFRRGFDGWLYINHGFANESVIRGRDGSSVQLQSGNTYRVRLDGSRVEPFTWGQVNPFGSTFLADGDLLTADCHSKPLTYLLRGGYYSSFGKPHDGLGFAPDLMLHDHGSTAICGVAQLTGDTFPPDWQGRLLVGNVMTSRINQDLLESYGSSRRAKEQPDFLQCDDPWFRPVDLQLGPDGSLYIADFYNRIIGHYEVPLDHPGRDKHRARIWRVQYRADGARSRDAVSVNLAKADADTLAGELAHPNLTRRMLATDQLSDRLGNAAIPVMLRAAEDRESETTRVHALWVLHRARQLPAELLRRAADDPSELVRIHAQRMASETEPSSETLREIVLRGLSDPEPMVRRAAADAAGRHPHDLVPQLLAAIQTVPAEDPALRYSLRMAVRNQLRRPESWQRLRKQMLSPADRSQLAEIALAVPTAEAAEFLFDELEPPGGSGQGAGSMREDRFSFLATHLPPERLETLVERERRKPNLDEGQQAHLLLSLSQRMSQRGLSVFPAARDWGTEVVQRLLASSPPSAGWSSRSGNASWGLEPRRCSDGQTTQFLSSLPGGERQTGILRSAEFVIPDRLQFYLCGHLGFPDRAAVADNLVQLRLAASDEVVARAIPPRHDTAQPVVWELAPHAGKRGYLELVDGLELDAYAWLAVARFTPPVVQVPATAPSAMVERQVIAAQLAMNLRLPDLQDPFRKLVQDRQAHWRARQGAAQMLLADAARPLLSAATVVLAEPLVDAALREQIVAAVLRDEADADAALLVTLMRSVPAKEQRLVADALAASPAGARELLQLVERGQAAPRLLQDRAIQQKLEAHGIPDLPMQLTRLTASLPTLDAELQRLIDERRREFARSEPNLARGQELFTKHCQACHQVRGQGALVGPQLDGIGNRGASRVIEDVLDPNRNVDATFHVSVLSLADGRVISGLVRREEGENLVLVDQRGKEFTVPRADIEERSLSTSSLMPANVPELMKPDEFFDLIGFLLTLRAAP